MTRRFWAALAAVVAVGLHAPLPVDASGDESDATPGPTITVVSQTPFVARDGVFRVRARIARAPRGAMARLVLHDRVVSRGEFQTSLETEPLRRVVATTEAVPLAELPRDRNGAISLTLPIASDREHDEPRTRLVREGTYPLEIEVLDADGAAVSDELTYLVLLPPATDRSPRLSLSLIVQVEAPLALRPDGTLSIGTRTRDALARVASVLADRRGMPLTLAVRPETLDALSRADDEASTAVIDDLRQATADDRPVVALPYAPVQPEALVDRALVEELEAQVDTGRSITASLLDRQPVEHVWLADPTTDDDALAAARGLGAEVVVVPDAAVEPLDVGTVDPARWFEVEADEDTIPAAAADDDLAARLGGLEAPALEAQRFVAELAALWFERPAIDRGVVVVVPAAETSAVVLDRVVASLRGSRIVRPVTMNAFFASVDPFEGDDGEPAVRALTPEPSTSLGSLPTLLADVRAGLASYTSMVGDDAPQAAELERLLLASQSADLIDEERSSYVKAAADAIADSASNIETAERATVTLTAREGTIPLTVRNGTGIPVRVRVELDSDKLEFRDGETFELVLRDETTRIDLDVRTRASGAFPLDIHITSPDGGIVIAQARYTVRSTAFSGVGLVLSAGAGVFLLIWWSRHWRDARRSRRLVTDARHLARQVPADEA